MANLIPVKNLYTYERLERIDSPKGRKIGRAHV